VIKFRTMVKDASSPKHRLGERFMRDGYLDIPLDWRGLYPDRKDLGEIANRRAPQLLNVLIDGMSLVGNRPCPRKMWSSSPSFRVGEALSRARAGSPGSHRSSAS